MRNYYIIEKNKHIIRTIQEVLENFGQFHCLGYSNDRETVLKILLEKQPELVFCCIDAAVFKNAFHFITELHLYDIRVPDLIAISATKRQAYTAFKYNFLDYILSSAPELEVRKSVLRYIERKPFRPNLLCLKSYRDYHYIDTSEILFLKADNYTTDIYMTDGRTIGAFKTLKVFEQSLPYNFLRIHKSYIVNADYVSRIHFGKGVCMVKRYKKTIPFTPTFQKNIDRIHRCLGQSSI
ncbi:LytR/AlgR family response regulator transcription factor [Sinomicrobium oceani]|uniref:LytR/AlgR family response regulator transcription factor n=1 Tax=Sinomicrobium oceani TaxID=1150368 RepID=UPI00227CE38D|nr:LytTR family transcriptional regulator DNA-binding domain-containing protein [Sinomicrobium oceani]